MLRRSAAQAREDRRIARTVKEIVILQRNLLKHIVGRRLICDSIVSVASGGLGRSASLLASVVVAVRYGATSDTDSYYLVFTLLSSFFVFFQEIFNFSFVPLYAEIRAMRSVDAHKLLGSLLVISVIAGMVLLVLFDSGLWLFSPFFYPSASEETNRTLVALGWEMSPVLVASVLSAFFLAIFNAERWFAAAGLMPMCSWIGIVIFGVCFKEAWGVHALAIGLVVGTVFQLAMMYVYFKSKGCAFAFDGQLFPPAIQRVVTKAIPAALGLAVFFCITVADRVIVAVFLPEGNITALENAINLCRIPWSLATIGYMNVFFSWWSQKSSEGDIRYINSSLRKLFLLSAIVFVPISLILFWWATPLVRAVYGYGQYTNESVATTSEVFGYLVLGYGVFMLRHTLIRFYAAQQNTSVVAKVAVCDFCVHVIVAMAVINKMGVSSIGIATSLGYFVSFLYLLVHHFTVRNPSFLSTANASS